MTDRWRNPFIEWRGGKCTLPEHTHTVLVDYIEVGADPYDDFFYALLTNDLKGAVHYADDINLRIIPNIVAWLYNYAPSACQGTEYKVKKWKENRGMQQFQKKGTQS